MISRSKQIGRNALAGKKAIQGVDFCALNFSTATTSNNSPDIPVRGVSCFTHAYLLTAGKMAVTCTYSGSNSKSIDGTLRPRVTVDYRNAAGGSSSLSVFSSTVQNVAVCPGSFLISATFIFDTIKDVVGTDYTVFEITPNFQIVGAVCGGVSNNTFDGSAKA